jgi:regulator of sigma E protease
MLLATILLVVILGVLIFVHELGHFLIAKKSGIRVDEFAIGFPPKLWSFERNGTKYSINLIPFGGFVKIFGENIDDEALDPNRKDSFLNKSKLTQAAVLIGGVLFNVIFAYILISISLMAGFPSIITDANAGKISDSRIVVIGILPDSPAQKAGIEAGDQILGIVKGENVLNESEITISRVQEIISAGDVGEITLDLRRNGDDRKVSLNTESGIISDKQAIGISMERIGILKFPFFKALWEGFKLTGQTIKEVAVGLFKLIATAVVGKGSLDDVAGPVGIVGLVDSARNFGFYYLLTFTAFISLNLAVLNILPLPALDGGRLFIILIEVIIRRPIKSAVVNWINGIGFALLILFMIAITVNDILRLI